MTDRDFYPDVFEDFEIDESDENWKQTSYPMCMDNAPLHIVKLKRFKNIVPLEDCPPPESAVMQYLRWQRDQERTWYFLCDENDSCLFCSGAKEGRQLLKIVQDARTLWNDE